MAASPSINAGEPIPGYRLIERIGRGGYGEVWKCEAPGGILKAIKFVYGDIENACSEDKSAEQELKALNRVKTIRHPFVLSLERFDIVEGQLLIVMELADRNLWDRYQECRKQELRGIPRDELIAYMEETAEALDLMNEQYQLQHLDIKPQNLFLVYNHIKVADFGLAKDLQGIRATMTGGVTPLYAAPETFEGWVSRFCDQYSMAIVYQELLTGERPFSGTNVRNLMMQHLSAVPNVSSLSEEERPIILRALSKTPDDRYPTCRDLVRALKSAKRNSLPDVAPKISLVPSGDTPTRDSSKPGELEPPPSTASALTLQPIRSQTLRLVPKLKTPVQRKPEDSQSLSPPSPSLPPTSQNLGQLRALSEKRDKGILFPMLIIGIGGYGAASIRQIKKQLGEKFPDEKLPNVQYLLLDTDSQEIDASSSYRSDTQLSKEETLHLSLHRPAHYLKQTLLPPVEQWHDPELLYKIPRDGGTMGVRALGRLSLLDHQAAVKLKFGRMLKKVMRDTEGGDISGAKGLGLRSTFPRVYIVGSLMGGTGSGIALDLAYMLKQELRKVGYDPNRVSAHFFLPRSLWSNENSLQLEKPMIALREIDTFMSGKETFRAVYSLKEEPFTDSERPFDSITLHPVEKTGVKSATTRHLEVLSETLIQEGFTNLGKSRFEGELRKRDVPNPYRNVASVRLTWPRQRLLQDSLGRLTLQLQNRWIETESSSDSTEVIQFTKEFLQKKRLDNDSLRKQLDEKLTVRLGYSIFDKLIETEKAIGEGRGQISQIECCNLIEPLVQIVGSPGSGDDHPSKRAFAECFKELAKETEKRLSEMVVQLVEMPSKRFGFSLKFLKRIDQELTETIEQIKQLLHKNASELESRYDRMLNFIGNLDNIGPKLSVRRSDPRSELRELISTYVNTRLESQREYALQCVVQSWKGILPEFTRDINFCKEQSREMLEEIRKASKPPETRQFLELHILPGKSKEIEEASDSVIQSISENDWDALDERLQVRIRRECSALVKVCLQKMQYKDRFLKLIREELLALAETRLPVSSSVEMFLSEGRDPQLLHREIQRAFDELSQTMLTGRLPEGTTMHFLGLPNSPSKANFQALLADVISEVHWTDYPSEHDIVLSCEQKFAAGRLYFGYWENNPSRILPQDKFLFSRTDFAWFKGFDDPRNGEGSSPELFAESLS